MNKFILGKKLGMTTIYGETGEAANVTLVECVSKISLIRTKEKDGYSAVQLEMPKTKKRSVKREFRSEAEGLKAEDEIKIDIFAVGDRVNVGGISKAKGFQGVVKRHGFKGSPKTHGHKHDLRAPGSIGAGFPEHVIKGKKMAGRMGGGNTTSRNVRIALVDKSKNILGLEGAVPGIPGSVVEIFTI